MGTFRSIAKDLTQTGTDEDEDYIGEEESAYEEEGYGSVDAGAATKGSEPLTNPIGMNSHALHSSMIIRSLSDDVEEPDVEDLLEAEGESPALGAPPAYTGSMRSSRRASYAARNDIHGSGTVMREADLGTGVDTIRPVKKVDAAGSLKLSADFVGSVRRDGSGSIPSSPTRERTSKRGPTELAKAGISIVDNVVLPILQNVGVYITSARALNLPLPVRQAIRDDMDAREIESLSMLSRGFTELKEANPELAYNVILDVLSGINEYVTRTLFKVHILITFSLAMPRCAIMSRRRAVCSHTSGSFARAK